LKAKTMSSMMATSCFSVSTPKLRGTYGQLDYTDGI
jgi:hypothetical protein